MPPAAIECQGLTRRYGSFLALDNLTLTVESGAVFGFLGPNGAGKTTTIKLLTGLLHPHAGRAYVAGEEIRVEEARARSRFGYLPEDPVFYNWMTGSEVLTYAGRLFGLSDAVLRQRVPQTLERVGLADAAKRRVGGFSRGMRQRLGLAQALIHNPPVLILDEPASALDPIGRREILDMIRSLKDSETTVFMSTHILADVERTCDTVAVINKGRLVTVADQQELRQRYALPVFVIELEGSDMDVQALVVQMQRLPWIERVDGENHVLRVFVTDAAQARVELPRLIISSPLVLTKYEQGVPSLEDAFLRLLDAEPAQGRQTATVQGGQA